MMSWCEALRFVRENLYRVEPEPQRSRCVDGRYKPCDDLPGLAKPGGDAGDLVTIAATARRLAENFKMDPAPFRERALEALLNRCGGPARFRLHTDEEALKRGSHGCGHLKHALHRSSCPKYGLSEEDALWVGSAIQALLRFGAKEEVLRGPHQEKAVMVVDAPGYGLAPSNGNGSQVFVYHRGLDLPRLRALAREFRALLPKRAISAQFEELYLEIAEAQLKETITRLAPCLPCYAVNVGARGHVVEKLAPNTPLY